MKKMSTLLMGAVFGVFMLSACQAKTTMPTAMVSPSQSTQKTSSGLGYKVVKQGTGKTAGLNDEVEIRFMSYDSQGRPLDGTMSGVPVIMRPSDMFAGLKEGLMMMNAGSIYEFYIPARLGFSEDEGLTKQASTYRVEMIAVNP